LGLHLLIVIYITTSLYFTCSASSSSSYIYLQVKCNQNAFNRNIAFNCMKFSKSF
ncbi:unnamed protein product, partial [Musa textilis]